MAAWTAALGRALDEAGDDAGLRAVIMMDQAVAASNAGNFAEAIRYRRADLGAGRPGRR